MTIPNVVLGELIDPVTFGNAVVDAVNKHETEIADRLPLSGGTVTGELQVDGQVQVASGSYTKPAYSFKDNLNSGLYGAANFVAVSVNGEYRLVAYDTHTLFRADLQVDGNIQAYGDLQVDGDLQVRSQNRAVRVMDSGRHHWAELGFTTSDDTIPAHGYLSGNTVTIKTGADRAGLQDVLYADNNGNVRAYGDLRVDGTITGQVVFGIAADINTADVLDRAETATMPVIDDDDDDDPAPDLSDVVTVNEVVTALLAKVRQLEDRLAALEA